MVKAPSSSSAISVSIVAIVFILASFASCLAAEFNRTTKKELKLKGRFCFVPESEAFKLGVAGLVCLIMGHIIGNVVICHSFWPNHNGKTCSLNKPLISTTLLISWVSFGIAAAMMSGATSMSRRQEYGKGWLEGECYLVKDGIFVGAAVFVLINGCSTAASAAVGRTAHVITGPTQIHAQTG